MNLAAVQVSATNRTDNLLWGVARHLANAGYQLVGALRPPKSGHNDGICGTTLHLLPDGPDVCITQDLGKGSAACRLDAGAIEDVAGRSMARLQTEGADIVFLNKFGITEAEGRGFRQLIGAAMGQDVPVVIGVSDAHRAAFEAFTDDMAEMVPPEEEALLDWCRRVVPRRPSPKPIPITKGGWT